MVWSVYQPREGSIDSSHYAGRALIKLQWELQSHNSAYASCSDATMNAEMALRMSE